MFFYVIINLRDILSKALDLWGYVVLLKMQALSKVFTEYVISLNMDLNSFTQGLNEKQNQYNQTYKR